MLYLFSDYKLSNDYPAAVITRLDHLIRQHNSTEFMRHTGEGTRLLCEVTQLLGTAGVMSELLSSLVESCNPYNYALISALLQSSEQEVYKKVGE